MSVCRLLVAACATAASLDALTSALALDYPMMHGDAANSGLAEPGVDALVGLVEQVVFPETGSIGAITGSPAIAYGRVYIGTQDGVVHCLNATTMCELWSTQLTGAVAPAIHTTPAVHDGRVWVVSRGDEALHVLDAYMGTVLSSHPLGPWPDYSTGGSDYHGWLDPSVTIHDDVAYLTTPDGSIRAYDASVASSIAETWSEWVGGPLVSTPAVVEHGGDVLVYTTRQYADAPSDLVCFNATERRIEYEYSIDTSDFGRTAGPVLGSLTIDTSSGTPFVYVTTEPGDDLFPDDGEPPESYYIFGIDGAPDSMLRHRWGQNTQDWLSGNMVGCFMPGTPVAFDGHLFVNSGRGFFKLRLNDGGFVGMTYLGHDTNSWSSVMIAEDPSTGGGYAYFVENDGPGHSEPWLVCLDTGDLSYEWTSVMSSSASSFEVSSPAATVVGGNTAIFVGSTTGKVIRVTNVSAPSPPAGGFGCGPGSRESAPPTTLVPTKSPEGIRLSLVGPDVSRRGDLQIFDVTGRVVAELRQRAVSASWDWDLSDRSGARVSPGVYFAKAHGLDAARIVVTN